MAAVEASERLGLLDLPPEVRNMIYKLLHLEGSRSKLSRYHDEIIDPLRPLLSPGLRRHMRLLRVSRQIHEETARVAYGAIVFKLRASESTTTWLKGLGSMKQYICKVYMEGHLVMTHFRAVLHQLKQTNHLEWLGLGNSIRNYNGLLDWPAVWVADMLKPFARAINKKQRGPHAMEETIRKFRAISQQDLYFRLDRSYVIPEKDKKEHEEVAKWQEELRKELLLIL